MTVNPAFWQGKRVFLTGHTGFKGGWISLWLASMGAKVAGYALAPATQPNLFEVANVAAVLEESHFADILDRERLTAAMVAFRPDVVIHMAAQALVRHSYDDPVETYATNVMGTVHVLDAIRQCRGVRAALMVTSDKCYQNNEWPWGYRENEPMGGYDPYSNSKGCAELVTAAYRQSFFPAARYAEHGVAVASGRAGNVIGGGDWSADRLVPDAIAAFQNDVSLKIRNPDAVRPWQHVLEPVSGYLVLAQALAEQGTPFNGGWNFGPEDDDARSVREVVESIIRNWGDGARWERDGAEQPHEAHFLKLDCSKAKQHLGWRPNWNLATAIGATVAWHRARTGGKDMQQVCLAQIQDYAEAAKERAATK
ncbi:CDP-glucose 4,6-dehydratase [Paraburkholderia caballeronis]|uniref:CDP-glucose 4,6-dehydratase n=1 Tax=Paraburkholderia caballeronis TaxID=416943 RepID=UPI0010658083|nr:CDP-glucose 4,6-dehydratase [Paraburkholderia caballeronis]TDV34721.1 CDP-glucose 4,6-dehydratase [Paraburkholderia caballeronis]